MGKYSTVVRDHLVVPARVQLTWGQEQLLRLAGRAVPSFLPASLLIDTGSKRSTLVPSVVTHLNPFSRGTARIETSLATAKASLYWVRLEFPGTSLAPVAELAVVRLPVPASLAAFHGVIGRDLLARWEYVFFEGRREEGNADLHHDPGGSKTRLRAWRRLPIPGDGCIMHY